MPTAATPTKFRARNGENGDTRSAQPRIRPFISIISDNDPWFQCHHIIAIVPLFAGLLKLIAASGNDTQFAVAFSGSAVVLPAAFFDGDIECAFFAAGAIANWLDAFDDALINGH